MRIITMFLPQYHRIPENDEWWGEGFTDWDTVKNATKLYDGHDQPHKPLNGYYYNLLEKETMMWQADLMHRFGIDGMCFYHYWFKDGRTVLEKPAENLLEWSDINMPFCFCWANETWARSWSNISASKNTWADTFDKSKSSNADQDKGILLLQDYGEEKEWKKHIEYLIHFFRDERYIKIDGRPVILIYRVSEIDCIYDMVDLWRRTAKEEGFPDIYIIGGNCEREMASVLDGQLYHEPQLAIRKIRTRDNRRIFSYDEVWDEILQTKRQYNMQPYFEGFVRYDDSPRRGKEGLIVQHSTPADFEKYLKKLISKNHSFGTEITFINAWNEWGEGMYLEPDTKSGFEYLDAVRRASSCKEMSATMTEANISLIKGEDNYIDRVNGNLQALSKWLTLFEKGFSLAEWIHKEYPEGIILYGYGVLGRHLYDECKRNGITVHCVIEKHPEKVHISETVITVDNGFPAEYTIIVSAIFDYDIIYREIKDKGNYRIVSLAEIIDRCLAEVEGKLAE